MFLPGITVDNNITDVRFAYVKASNNFVYEARKVAGDFCIPKGITLYWYSPSGVTKVEISFARSVRLSYENQTTENGLCLDIS